MQWHHQYSTLCWEDNPIVDLFTLHQFYPGDKLLSTDIFLITLIRSNMHFVEWFEIKLIALRNCRV